MWVRNLRKYRTFLIVFLFLVEILMGIRTGYFIELGIEKFLYAIAVGLAVAKICEVDSRIVGKPLPINSFWLIFFFYSIAAPICLFRTRRMKGLLIFAAYYIGILFVYGTFFYITYFLTYGL